MGDTTDRAAYQYAEQPPLPLHFRCSVCSRRFPSTALHHNVQDEPIHVASTWCDECWLVMLLAARQTLVMDLRPGAS